MSYCVNCGVELAPSERRCPLCNVEVVNPIRPWVEPVTRPYPTQLEKIVRRVDRRYFAAFTSILLLIPLLVTLLIDLLDSSTVSWSAYPAGGVALLFLFVEMPLFARRQKIYVFYAVDCVSLLGYLALIDAMNEPMTWFLPLGMPLTVALFLSIAALTWLFRHWLLSIFTRSAAIIGFCGVYSVIVELLVNSFQGISLLPRWSGFAAVPCFVIAAALLILRGRKRLRSEIHRRLFM